MHQCPRYRIQVVCDRVFTHLEERSENVSQCLHRLVSVQTQEAVQVMQPVTMETTVNTREVYIVV